MFTWNYTVTKHIQFRKKHHTHRKTTIQVYAVSIDSIKTFTLYVETIQAYTVSMASVNIIILYVEAIQAYAVCMASINTVTLYAEAICRENTGLYSQHDINKYSKVSSVFL